MKIILLILALAIGISAQSKIYITPMENDFDSFIAAAILSKKIPVAITTDESLADYILVGGSTKGDNKWSDTIFGNEKDRNQGSIRLIRPSDKSVVFAASAGDKSLFFSALKKTGQKKVADRLAQKLKDYFKTAK